MGSKDEYELLPALGSPWTLQVLDYQGKTSEAETSFEATAMTELENSKGLAWGSKNNK